MIAIKYATRSTKEVQYSPLGISAEVLGTDIGMDAAFGVSLEGGGGVVQCRMILYSPSKWCLYNGSKALGSAQY